MICCSSAVNKCPFSKECLVFGKTICCPFSLKFRMKCLAPYTVPLALIEVLGMIHCFQLQFKIIILRKKF